MCNLRVKRVKPCEIVKSGAPAYGTPEEAPMATRLVQRLLTCLLTLLVLSGCAGERAQSAQKSKALTPAESRTTKFELLSDWHRFSGVGRVASSREGLGRL